MDGSLPHWLRGAFVGAVVAGLVAAVVYALAIELLRRRRYRKALRPYAGEFQAHWKYQDRVDPETLVIKVKANRLKVTAADAEHPYCGEILMNEAFLQSGSGQYSQIKDGKQLWGTWDVRLLDPDNIFVDRTYTHYAKMEAVLTGFVWKRRTPGYAPEASSPTHQIVTRSPAST